MEAAKPNILAYQDYRRFLQDWFASKKSGSQKFTHRAFAKDAGFSSSNYLQLVMTGKRNLSVSKAAPVAMAMGLKKFEQHYFETLIKFAQAPSIELRSRFAKELVKIKKSKGDESLPDHLFQLYSEPFLVHLREMVSLPSFEENPEWIASHLNFDVSPDRIKTALDLLEKLGFLQRDAKGKLRQKDTLVQSGNEVLSAALFGYQHTMIQEAQKALETLPGSQRDVSSVTARLSWESLKIVKEKIIRLRNEILELERDERAAEDVFQLNLQLFPTTSCKFNSEKNRGELK